MAPSIPPNTQTLSFPVLTDSEQADLTIRRFSEIRNGKEEDEILISIQQPAARSVYQQTTVPDVPGSLLFVLGVMAVGLILYLRSDKSCVSY